ncbi:MAG TPA: hypothetical protein VFB99_13705, partial [Vicinamibacterales bacterium]|nr:hypothetical protein [Vicinamibacterales bacterium]
MINSTPDAVDLVKTQRSFDFIDRESFLIEITSRLLVTYPSSRRAGSQEFGVGGTGSRVSPRP